MPIADAEYESLARRLEELRSATDPALSRERAELQKKMTDILVSRRQTDRFQCHLKVDFESGAEKGQGVVNNLGAGGAYLKTTAALQRFATVALKVAAPGRLPVGTVLNATVRWVKPNDGAGVAFSGLEQGTTDALKKALGELVREQPPKLSDPQDA